MTTYTRNLGGHGPLPSLSTSMVGLREFHFLLEFCWSIQTLHLCKEWSLATWKRKAGYLTAGTKTISLTHYRPPGRDARTVEGLGGSRGVEGNENL